jgi:hypothetical protein
MNVAAMQSWILQQKALSSSLKFTTMEQIQSLTAQSWKPSTSTALNLIIPKDETRNSKHKLFLSFLSWGRMTCNKLSHSFYVTLFYLVSGNSINHIFSKVF